MHTRNAENDSTLMTKRAFGLTVLLRIALSVQALCMTLDASAAASGRPTANTGVNTNSITNVAGIDLNAAQQALEAWRLTDVQRTLSRSAKDADSQYIAARLALGTYKHEAAQRLAAECEKLAVADAQRSRCSEVEGEALALRVALSGDDLGTLGLAGRLKATLQRATRVDPRNVRAQQLLARYYRVAPWLLGGSASQANACIAQAIRLQPALADELRGIDAFDARDYARAVPLLQRALRAQPQRAAPGYYLALAHEQLNNADAARAQLAETQRQFPEFWEASFRLASFEVESHPAQAAALLRSYIARAGNAGQKRLAKSYRYLGQAEEHLGHRELAIDAYRRALKLKPGDNAADKALGRLMAASSAAAPRATDAGN